MQDPPPAPVPTSTQPHPSAEPGRLSCTEAARRGPTHRCIGFALTQGPCAACSMSTTEEVSLPQWLVRVRDSCQEGAGDPAPVCPPVCVLSVCVCV